MQYQITREELIPTKDENWNILQMKLFQFGVTVKWWETDTREMVEKETDDLFISQRDKLSVTDPLITQKQKQIRYLLGKLKLLVWEKELNEIIELAKKIK